MREQSVRTLWWKFAEYEILADRISPMRGLEPQRYDPWKAYEKSKLTNRGEPPYLALLRFISGLDVDFDLLSRNYDVGVDGRLHWEPLDSSWISPYAKTEILSFCREYGLLGILQQQTVSIRADWEWNGQAWIRREFTRVGGRWIDQTKEAIDEDELDDELKPETLHYPFVGDENRSLLQSTPTVEVCSRFEARLFFSPASEEWWSSYKEPVEDFLFFAFLLARAIDKVDGPALNEFMSSGGDMLRVSKQPRMFPRYPSLISMFARMAAEDLVSGGRLFHCACCYKPTITDRGQTLYCSDRCAWRERKRRKRAQPDIRG